MRPKPEMGTRRLISGSGSKMLKGARGGEEVDKQSRSDPMETVRPGKSRSDSPEVSSRETEKIALSHDKRATHEIYVVLKAMTRNKRATHVTFVVLKAMRRYKHYT